MESARLVLCVVSGVVYVGGVGCVLLSWTIILVTRTAVSVVICTGPSRRPWYPFLRSSEVRSMLNLSVARTD